MGKKGPCFHCGIDRTPLWRNGPPEKPVLCNACGSRYRLGKPLENYTPKNNILVLRRRKQKAAPKTTAAVEKPVVTSNSSSNNVLEDHCASSESSTIISHNLNHEEENRDDEINPESCGGISLWSSQIPSRRRTQVVYSSLTTIQKLQRDLHKILRHEGPFNGTEPDDVLIHNTNINKLQIPPREIGLGSILLKFPVTHQEQKNELPCSPGLLDAEIAAPPLLENACGNHDDDVEGVQNKASPIELENNGGNSPTKGAADS